MPTQYGRIALIADDTLTHKGVTLPLRLQFCLFAQGPHRLCGHSVTQAAVPRVPTGIVMRIYQLVLLRAIPYFFVQLSRCEWVCHYALILCNTVKRAVISHQLWTGCGHTQNSDFSPKKTACPRKDSIQLSRCAPSASVLTWDSYACA